MKVKTSILMGTLILSGCAGQLTQEGKSIHITPSNSIHLQKCEMLGPVTESVSIGGLWDRGEQRKAIKFALRNKTAQMYPNADTVAYNDLDLDSSPVDVMATVFTCFKK